MENIGAWHYISESASLCQWASYVIPKGIEMTPHTYTWGHEWCINSTSQLPTSQYAVEMLLFPSANLEAWCSDIHEILCYINAGEELVTKEILEYWKEC